MEAGSLGVILWLAMESGAIPLGSFGCGLALRAVVTLFLFCGALAGSAVWVQANYSLSLSLTASGLGSYSSLPSHMLVAPPIFDAGKLQRTTCSAHSHIVHLCKMLAVVWQYSAGCLGAWVRACVRVCVRACVRPCVRRRDRSTARVRL